MTQIILIFCRFINQLYLSIVGTFLLDGESCSITWLIENLGSAPNGMWIVYETEKVVASSVVLIIPCLLLKVSGEAIDTELNLRRRGASYSILFYAAWCPFSSKFRPIFQALSTMYPQIHHFSVEESSATPRYVDVELFSVSLLKWGNLSILEQKLLVRWIAAHCTASAHCSLFSRYGVRGFPAILLVNETTMVRYRGSKDLSSLVDFYKETTGTNNKSSCIHSFI